MCVCAGCVRVCIPHKRFLGSCLVSVEVIIVKVDTATASDMRMHHVLFILFILTLTFIQGHTTALNDENNECFIISATIQAIPINFAVIVRL